MKINAISAERGQTPEQPPELAAFETDGSVWEALQEELILNYQHIIALRGAGANNGIDAKAATELLEQKLIPKIKEYLATSSVALLFDGDPDDPQRPDIGYIMGRLRDEFIDEPDEKITFVTAQKESWYYPTSEGAALTNANDLPYQTIVFKDHQFVGDHDSFTQSATLANAAGYEQWYIGASGDIATNQLRDLNDKIFSDDLGEVTFFPAPINLNLTEMFEQKLQLARENQDTAAIEKFEKILKQRHNRFGSHFDDNGMLSIDASEFPRLKLEVVT